jgi:hypothetical protein
MDGSVPPLRVASHDTQAERPLAESVLDLLAYSKATSAECSEAPVSERFEKYRVVVDGPAGFISERYADNLNHAKELLSIALWRYLKPAYRTLKEPTP